MKTLSVVLAGIAIMAGIGIYLYPRPKTVAPKEPEPQTVGAVAEREAVQSVPTSTERVAALLPRTAEYKTSLESNSGALDKVPVTVTAKVEARPLFDQAMQVLTSAQSTYGQRQAAWKQMKEAGKLDLAITQLEQRVAGESRTTDDTTALGQAYWQKCTDTKDKREQAILAMKADQTFEAALNLDPNNWEARFTRALGMSYWPKEMNKGPEVLSQFTELIKQQEMQTQQPQFASTYTYLGDQYQKSGQADYARQVWQRGVAYFPNDSDLKQRLLGGP